MLLNARLPVALLPVRSVSAQLPVRCLRPRPHSPIPLPTAPPLIGLA